MSKSRQNRRFVQPSFWEGDISALISVTVEANRVVRRCGDVPLGGVFRAVKRFLHFSCHKSSSLEFPGVYEM
jgi:hypothetical protein